MMSVRRSLQRLERRAEQALAPGECRCQGPVLVVTKVEGEPPFTPPVFAPVLCEHCGGVRAVIYVNIVQPPLPPGRAEAA